MKRSMLIVAGCLVAIVIFACIIVFKAGAIVRHGIEEFGPKITGTPVTLRDVDISLLSGKARIQGVVLGNPKGFKSESAVKVSEIAVSLDMQSLFSDNIRIQKILINDAKLSYEVGKYGSNIKAIQRNIEKSTEGASGSDKTAQTKTADPQSISLSIDDVVINKTRVNLAATVLNGKGGSVLLPDIHLKDIGKGAEGVSPEVAAKIIFGAITKNLGKDVTQILPAQLKMTIDKEVGDSIKGVGRTVKGLLGGEQ